MIIIPSSCTNLTFSGALLNTSQLSQLNANWDNRNTLNWKSLTLDACCCQLSSSMSNAFGWVHLWWAHPSRDLICQLQQRMCRTPGTLNASSCRTWMLVISLRFDAVLFAIPITFSSCFRLGERHGFISPSLQSGYRGEYSVGKPLWNAEYRSAQNAIMRRGPTLLIVCIHCGSKRNTGTVDGSAHV